MMNGRSKPFEHEKYINQVKNNNNRVLIDCFFSIYRRAAAREVLEAFKQSCFAEEDVMNVIAVIEQLVNDQGNGSFIRTSLLLDSTLLPLSLCKTLLHTASHGKLVLRAGLFAHEPPA